MSNLSIFRVWLRRRRQEHGLTQEDLGELVGYAGQTITKIEGGQRRPSPQLALRLAEALQIPPAEQPAWMAAALADDEPEAPATLASTPVAVPPRHPAPPQGLPAYLTPFVGREREQAELVALLERPDCRLVTVLGQGGVGKTRLAVETGRASQSFPDGTAFVSLASVAAPASLVPAIGDTLGCAFSGAGDLVTQLTGHLRGQRALLILDNLEHLLDPAGVTLGLLERLLAQAPEVSVLATSRERLRLAGEWVLELEGLPVPPHAPVQPGAAPALRLFAEHAERVDRAFRLTPENAATITTICRLVDGLPLGIELAAAWLRLLPLDEIANELTRDLDAAHVSPRSLPARHHSLRAVVDHSWQLLNANERAALRQLSVFQGGFTREAAARVADARLGVLASLVDKSLLRRSGSGRYDLHEIIRQYADARLGEHADELTATHGRHAAYFLRLVAEREQRIKGADQLAAMAELSAEIDNIRAAWPWATAGGQLDELEGAGETLHWFYEFRSWLQEGADLFDQAVERLRSTGAGETEPAWRRTFARLLGHYGYLATRLGAFAKAHAALAESHTLLADRRDPVGLSRTLLYQAQLAHWTGDYAEARRLLDHSLDLTNLTGDRAVRAMGQTIASLAAHAVGRYDEAEQLFRAALASWREQGNPRGTVWCITACAMTLLTLGKGGEAQQLLRESLALSYATQDSGGLAMTLHNLGHVALHQGDVDEAIYFIREALPSLRTASPWVYAHALNDLGAALWQSGAKGEARRAYGEALEMAIKVQARHQALQAMASLAMYYRDAGQHATALGLATRVLADPASTDETRRTMAELQRAARAHLPADEAARIEERAGALSLPAVLAELARPTGLL